MIRLTRQTDIGILLLTLFAQRESGTTLTARELADETGITFPTVSKVLKVLSRSGLLASLRGQKGGYVLGPSPDDISVADMVEALEGPIALTECAGGEGNCDQEGWCPVGANMRVISQAVHDALSSVTLTRMATPRNPALFAATVPAPE